MDAYSPVRGKCTWWREVPVEEDAHNIMIKPDEKRVRCTCFVEGHFWTHQAREVPEDCPLSRSCRYFIRSG